MSRPLGIALALVLYGVSLTASREDLARARLLFNDRKFDEAIQAADLARKTPDTADAGAIVMARAHLERYRQVADPADLGAARTALGGVNVERLGTGDRAEYLMALGGSLFLEDDFGAAAEIFESAIEVAPAAGRTRARQCSTGMARRWSGGRRPTSPAGVRSCSSGSCV